MTSVYTVECTYTTPNRRGMLRRLVLRVVVRQVSHVAPGPPDRAGRLRQRGDGQRLRPWPAHYDVVG